MINQDDTRALQVYQKGLDAYMDESKYICRFDTEGYYSEYFWAGYYAGQTETNEVEKA